MTKTNTLFAALLAALTTAALAQSPEGADLVVRATAFESTEGQATIILLNAETAWSQMMDDRSGENPAWKQHAAVADRPIEAGAAAVRFTGLQPGEYALMVFHDENANRKIDRNMMGMPKEEIGVSNDYRMSGFPPRKPTWDDVKFTVQPGTNEKRVAMGMLREARR
ncbi:MAG: DUF2141 domain-containing protein [Planctomycetota bacterium]